ncbi:hypothetical protein DOY81_006042, partial [Sarcophaga bullata]
MDLIQPPPHNNNTCESLTSMTFALESPTSITNNQTATTTSATIQTTNSISAIVAHNNDIMTSDSPRTSPTNSIISPHHQKSQSLHHHHNHTQNLVTQKPNQVSTVLLYNIPIVSLYIEGQERLCLAQISNTLLKQFSYNEIHNRRVALGITCVQCTPVQLEILRRAGAMPVSSRRCGMITRREAERLCKSFLGDNTPPRLPDDFAFNVHHKCSWGCRGSFLPSRYNSSRAKCIKCHYCGMFFSPNKFIFHSHRIGPGDKYVQPDAANFNSWRRHMMLSGQPQQEVIYAWEDVKAMFNGGTRKRLMTHTNSSSPLHHRVSSSSPSSCSAGGSTNNLNRDQCHDEVENGDTLINNIQKVQKSNNHNNSKNAVNKVTAAAAVVGVTAVAVGSTVRPLNLHFQTSTTAAGLATESSYSVGTDMHLIPAAALSRSFMMDYMWQHAHQATKSTYNQNYQHHQQPKVKSGNSAFTFPWINPAVGSNNDHQSNDGHHSNIDYTPALSTRWSNAASNNSNDITQNLSQIINKSAFKPVMQQHQQTPKVSASSTTKLRRQRHSTPSPSSRTSEQNTKINPSQHNESYNAIYSSDGDEHEVGHDGEEDQCPTETKNQISEEDSEVIDDDILVDIETTEDEKPLSFSTNTIVSRTTTCSRTSFTGDRSDEIHNDDTTDNDKQTPSDEDVIDVVHNDNDDTVLEFASLTPLAIIKDSKDNDRLSTLNSSCNSTPPVPTLKIPTKELDKLYGLDYNNTENVPPLSLSVSPKCNSNSSSSRSSEYLYIQSKIHYDTTCSTAPIPTNPSSSPEILDDHKINFNTDKAEKPIKTVQKRAFAKYAESDKISWRQSRDSSCTVVSQNIDEVVQTDTSNVESNTKIKKKTHERIAKEAQFIEALTQKYELTYYNNNNSHINNNSSSKNNYVTSTNDNTNNNNNNNKSNNNTGNNHNNNEFWHMARLCMQRPINYETNHKPQPATIQTPNNIPQITRLPTFYYHHHHQLLLSPTEQQQQQLQNITPQTFPATQQVYLHLQQHQQAVQKTQNQFINDMLLSPTSPSPN